MTRSLSLSLKKGKSAFQPSVWSAAMILRLQCEQVAGVGDKSQSALTRTDTRLDGLSPG